MNPEQLLAHFDRVSEAPDAVPRLRRFILDMALQGKLVGQDPADEPVEELLMRVEVEKLRLIKEGKIRERKRFQIKKVDSPFELPPSWRWVQIREISTLITKGSTPTSYGHSFVPSGINFIKVEGIKDSELAVNTVTSHISIETHEFLKRSQLEEGDFLFSIAGSIGTCAVVTKAILPANTNQALAIIRGTNVAFLPRFLQYSTSSSLIKLAVEKARGGAMNNISLEDVGNFALPLPPLAEQHRIVAKVDELMVLCDQLEAAREERERRRDRLAAASLGRIQKPAEDEHTFCEHARFHLANLSKIATRPDQVPILRKTILDLSVRGKLVPQDPNDEPASEQLKRIKVEKARSALEGKDRKSKKVVQTLSTEGPFDLPAGWSWARLSSISHRIHYGYTASANQAVKEVRLLRITDIQNDSVNWDSVPGCVISPRELEQFKLKRGDLVIARTGGTIGKTFLVADVPVVAVFASYLIRVQGSTELLARYLKLFTQSSVYWEQLQDGTRGGAQPNVNGQTLGRMAVPVPPFAEQHRIVEKVDELMALCDRLEVQLTSTQTESHRLLEALLHQALEPILKEISA